MGRHVCFNHVNYKDHNVLAVVLPLPSTFVECVPVLHGDRVPVTVTDCRRDRGPPQTVDITWT